MKKPYWIFVTTVLLAFATWTPFFAAENKVLDPDILEIMILLIVLTRLASTAVFAAVAYEILQLTARRVTETITPELLTRAPRAVA